MSKNRKPKKVIELNGRRGSYLIYSLTDGRYVSNAVPKDRASLLPLIDRGVYDGITPEAKEDILTPSGAKNTHKLVKRLIEFEL